MTENEIAWDMTEIFSNPNDPEIDNRINSLDKMVNDLEKEYKGKIIDLDAKGLLKLLQDFEKYLIGL